MTTFFFINDDMVVFLTLLHIHIMLKYLIQHLYGLGFRCLFISLVTF